MLRAPFIAITVVLLLRSGARAQHAPDWLQPAADDQLSVVATIEPTPPSNEDFVTRELFVESAELPVQRFTKQAIQTVTFTGGWLGATEGNDLSSNDGGMAILRVYPE